VTPPTHVQEGPTALADADGAAGVSLTELEAAVETALRRRGVEPASAKPLMGDQAARLRALVEAAPGVAMPAVDVVPASVMARGEAAPMAIAPLTIAVASGKGGVGKTNVATNLAAVLAGRGYRVVLLDADLGTANADVVCGLKVSARLEHVLTGELGVYDGARRSLGDILVEAPGGFRLIPGSAGVARLTELSDLDRRTLVDGLNALDGQIDVLIIDTAAGIGSGVTGFVSAADVCLVVSTPEPTSLADAYALIKCASMQQGGWSPGEGPRFELVMNQVYDGGEARRVGARLSAVCDRFLGLRVPMAGWIAQDVRVAEAVRARQLVVLRSPGSEAARNLSLLGDRVAQDLGLDRATASQSRRSGGVAGVLRRLFG
jgi:flagellar biosynthesis protein FlhG